MWHTIEAVFMHEFFLSFYGAVLYYVVIWSIARNHIQQENARNSTRKKFRFKEWFDEHYDEMLVTFGVVPLVVVFDDEIINIYNKTMEHDIEGIGRLVYLSAGPVTNLVYSGIKKVTEKKQ
jgi:glycerol uptake facilitator-like aquaporin